ncbi:MAG TPA: PAS domain S-box protein, partial [Anaerolineae bacterium]|nr:PAS domain S-box protein [Anaerolineae bacterium]
CVQLWESRYRRDFTLAELALCQGIAQQGAIALENARLFEQAQREIVERKRAEEILARQAQEMDQLNQVRTAIARELELPGLVQIVVKAIASAFGYELVSLYLLKDETLVLQYQVGYTRVTPQHAKMRKINYQVVQTKEAALVKHPYLDSPYLDISQEINTEICIPLFSRNKIVGTLHIASIGAKVLGETDLRLMVTLSEYVNIAFERAYLYTEARESEEKYRTLIEQSRDAIYLIYGNRFEIINHKFEELFGVTKEEINDPSFVFTNIVAPKSRRLIAEQAAVDGGLRYHRTPLVSPVYEFTALDKNGNEIEVELSVSYPTYKGGLATQGILRDITERK